MKFIKENLMQFVLVVSAFSIIGSLYFSEIVKFPPCSLCWYQRLFMYPIAIIVSVGLWKKDKNLAYFVLPFSIIGLIISAYHNLLYYGFISEAFQPCTIGASCTQRQLDLFGFVTIPILSLFGFILINIFTFAYYKFQNKK
jgi:disulfide bond formation protein DsbB